MIGSLIQYIVPFLVVLSVVVFVHEYGHYRIARRNGVRVETFSIGFGPELFGRNDRHGTRWKFSLVPLGGFVKMLGDAEPSGSTIDPDTAKDPDSFPAKTVWQRMAVVAAGPGSNFLFAILVLAILFATSGRPFTPPVVGQIQPGSPAAAAGLQPGDRIAEVDGSRIESFEQLQGIVRDAAGRLLHVVVQREGHPVDLDVTPKRSELVSRFGTKQEVGLIGVTRNGVEFRRSNVLMAPIDAATETAKMVGGTLYAVGQMIMGYRGTEELGGPLRIAQMSGQIAADGIVPLIWFTAVLSINLGLINLFPIPMLDGGHLLLYSLEAARGRPLTERTQEIAFRVGLGMVLSLMVYATWNDLVQLQIIKYVSGLIS